MRLRAKVKMPDERNRLLRMEALEARELLSVTSMGDPSLAGGAGDSSPSGVDAAWVTPVDGLLDGSFEAIGRVIDELVGDANGDGIVGIADLDRVRLHWQEQVTPDDLSRGDLTGDGVIGVADLDIVRNAWEDTLSDRAKEFDLFLFEAPADSILSAETARPPEGNAMDTLLRLFDADGNELTTSGAGNSGYSTITNYLFASDGTYYLGVSGEGNTSYDPFDPDSGEEGSSGDYHLSLSLSSGGNEAPVLASIGDAVARPGRDLVVPLSASDADADELSFSAEVSGDAAVAEVTIDNGNLVVTPYANCTEDFNVVVTVSDGLATAEQEFTVALAGTEARLIGRVLAVNGTEREDAIEIRDSETTLEVLDEGVLVGSFDKNLVEGIQVVALGGDDTVDVRDVNTPSWIYGGYGDDTIKGGLAADYVFGGWGVDDIEGRNGQDVLYGDGGLFDTGHLQPEDWESAANALNSGEVPGCLKKSFEHHGYSLPEHCCVDVLDAGHRWTVGNEHQVYLIQNGSNMFEVYGNEDRLAGEAGSDWFSLSPRVSLDGVPAGDHDIEALDYAEREYFNLMTRHRDAWGFVVTHDESGKPGDINDAGIWTGIGLATAALHGDCDLAMELLRTLRDAPFVENDGEVILARHPNSFNYVKDGDSFIRDGNQPMTKDGVVGIMSGLYYAYTADGMSAEVRALAREVMGDYIDYLAAHQWKTISHYPDSWWERDGKYFRNVFSGDAFGLNGDGFTSWKGPDAYALSPTDMYALQNAAAEMGFTTAHWQPWTNFGATVVQVLGDGAEQVAGLVGEAVADGVGQAVDEMLQKIDIHHPYSFHVIPGVDWTFVEGSLDISISQSDRENIVSLVRQAVLSYSDGLEELIRLADPVTDYATEIPALLSQLSGVAGRVADAVVDSLPEWAGADVWKPLVDDALQQVLPWLNGNAVGELVAFKLATEMAKEDGVTAHLSFWPTLLMYETRPEMADLLGPMVADAHDALNGTMDMLLFAWLDNDTGKVAEWIGGFESNESYCNLSYAWQQPRSDNAEDIGRPAEANPGHHRLDYLVLKELREHGVPAGTVVGDWLEHWGDELVNVGRQIEQAWYDLRDDLGAFAEALWDTFRPGIESLAEAIWEVSQDLPELADALWDIGWTTVSDIARGLGSVSTSVSDIAGALYSEVTTSLWSIADAMWDISWTTVSDIARGLGSVSTSVSDIAGALYSEVTTSLWSIADAMWDISWTTVSDIARGLGSVSTSVSDIAGALYSEVTTSLWSIADAMWDISWTTVSDIARGLGSVSTSVSDIAGALYSEVTTSLWSIADAMWGHQLDLGQRHRPRSGIGEYERQRHRGGAL